MTEASTNNPFSSEVIRGRLSKRLNGRTIEDFVGDKYQRDIKECLDILDIEYSVTAVGILGRVIENCTKDYCNVLFKNKRMFQTNSGNHSISKIRKVFHEASQNDRLEILNQKEVSKKIRNTTYTYKLKRKFITDTNYTWLLDIKNTRNEAFHGCESEEEYLHLESKACLLIEMGIIILISLIEETNRLR